jgi:hypothetical protein
VLAIAFSAGTASAQASKTIEQARDAFDQGAAAHTRGDYEKAAEYFALADELFPSDEALEAALDSATRADNAVLAMRLVDRSSRNASPAKGLADVRRVALERYRQKTGRLVVKCTTECSPSLDGNPIGAGVPTWTLTGSHTIVAVRGDARAQSVVDVPSEQLTEVTLTLPATTEIERTPRLPPSSNRLSPTWFWVTVGATGLLGGAAAVSGIDTVGRNDDFEKAGCQARGSAECDRLASDGRSSQLRTNLFLGGAAVTAVASVVLGAFFVDWRSRSPKSAALPLVVGPGGIAFTRTWP